MAVRVDSPALSPEPLGDMTLAPFAMTRRSESDLAHAMVQHLSAAELSSGAEALRALRNAFPQSPLAARCGIQSFNQSLEKIGEATWSLFLDLFRLEDNASWPPFRPVPVPLVLG